MKTKNILFCLFFLVYSISVSAQRKVKEVTASNDYIPSDAYISVGTGINYNTGIIGVQFEKKLSENVSGYIGAGFGTWGNKITIGGRYYYGAASNSALSFSYSYVTGSKGLNGNLIVVDSTHQSQGKTVTVNYDLLAVNTINLSWLKYWKMGKKSRFNIELGYSILLNTSGDNYTIKDPVVLTDASIKALQILQPGGLIVGIGFSFGL